MHLVCPTCKFAAYRPFVSLRLETCPRCARAGRQVYLVDGDRPIRPVTRRAN